MGWKPVEVDPAASLYRQAYESEREFKARVKDVEQTHAAREVQRFEAYLDGAVSLHRECSPHWNWAHVANSLAPVAPTRTNAAETAARQALDAFQPGLLSRLSGSAAEQRRLLEHAVQEGQRRDADANAGAQHRYQLSHRFWAEGIRVAPGVLHRDLALTRDALVHTGSFLDLDKHGMTVQLVGLHGSLAVLEGAAAHDDVVPREEAKLTAGGKLSIKAMTESKWWGLMQAHVCSAALRIAREAYVVLGVDVAVVNMSVTRMDPSIGHRVPMPVLGARFDKERFRGINLNDIEPAAAMKNFSHRMKFKKTTGFEAIEPMAHDEQWVST